MSTRFPRFLRRHAKAEPTVVPPPVSALAFEALADRVSKISGVIAQAYLADNSPVPCWLDDVDLGTIRVPPKNAPGHPESLTAELDPAHEIYLAALSNDLWPDDEYLDIVEAGAPALAGPVFYCPVCGRGSSAGPCGCGGRS